MRWKLVPSIPTPEMRDAANREYGADALFMAACVREAIAAAPPASQDDALVARIAFVLCEYDEENPGTCGCGGHCTNSHAIGQARAVLKMLERNQ